MVFFIKNIKIELTENIHGLTLTTSSGEFPLPGQNISETTEILQFDLNFQKKDFDHPYTYDIIIQYFKNKYPEDYEHKSSVMLDIPVEKLLKYEYDRAEFYKAFR